MQHRLRSFAEDADYDFRNGLLAGNPAHSRPQVGLKQSTEGLVHEGTRF